MRKLARNCHILERTLVQIRQRQQTLGSNKVSVNNTSELHLLKKIWELSKKDFISFDNDILKKKTLEVPESRSIPDWRSHTM